MRARLRLPAVLLFALLAASCASPGGIPGGRTLVVGLIADLSASDARRGNDVRKGAELRALALKAAGIGTVRVVSVDMKESPAEAVKALGRLAQETQASAVIDATFGRAGFVLGSAADDLGIPLVSLGTDDRVTTPEISAAGADSAGLLRRRAFLIEPTDSQLADAMARYALSRFPLKRYASLSDPADIRSTIQAWSFARAVKRAKALLVAAEGFPDNPGDAAPIQRVLDARPEAVFICGSVEQNVRAARDFRRLSRTVLLLGNEAWGGSFLERAGESAAGSWFAAAVSPDADALAGIASTFQEQFGQPPRSPALYGWDAVGLIADAAVRALSLDREKVTEALENTRGYTGTLGALSIDPSTHRADGPPVALLRIFGGRATIEEPRFPVSGGSFPGVK
ncbi:MAG TPA: ABC transporter substrate-binding protein [Spirochaetia bacterium]|nr:ABC transporter substrate-binding protein [Spirochaetia bacterium]